MKTILEELYLGNIYPNELIIPKDPKYLPLNKKMFDSLELWKKKLSAEDCSQLECLLDLRTELSSMENSASFIYGFKLGSWVMMEVLAEKEEMVEND
jgi:hypothetical protein